MKSEPGDICRIFIIFAGMKNRGAYQDASRFSFYCKVPFLVQEMETVRVVEVISELERIWEPVAEAYPVPPASPPAPPAPIHAAE